MAISIFMAGIAPDSETQRDKPLTRFYCLIGLKKAVSRINPTSRQKLEKTPLSGAGNAPPS